LADLAVPGIIQQYLEQMWDMRVAAAVAAMQDMALNLQRVVQEAVELEQM
jgi:hypothetical protein